MKNDKGSMKPVVGLLLVAATMLAMGAFCPPQALAQVPARFYWKTLSDANAVPLIVNSISGNTNPFDAAHTVTPGADFDATLALAVMRAPSLCSTERPWPLSSCPWAHLGRRHGGRQDVQPIGQRVRRPDDRVQHQSPRPPAQKNIPDVLRYEPGFSLDLIADLAFPIGEYDSDQSLNIGQNRWYGRLGLPIIWQLGAWVPGRRTTLEFLPAVWFFRRQQQLCRADVEDHPMFQVDAHLTRDFTSTSGVARRRLVLRRPSEHQRRLGGEAQPTWASGSRSATPSTTT